MEIGLIVKSAAGRDKGGLFVVLKTEGEFAWIADGAMRKAERPKKKKLRHIVSVASVSEKLREKLEHGEPVTNKELRTAIAEYQD